MPSRAVVGASHLINWKYLGVWRLEVRVKKASVATDGAVHCNATKLALGEIKYGPTPLEERSLVFRR